MSEWAKSEVRVTRVESTLVTSLPPAHMCDDARLTTPPEAYITVSTSRVVVVDPDPRGADPKEGVGTRVGRGAVEGETALSAFSIPNLTCAIFSNNSVTPRPGS